MAEIVKKNNDVQFAVASVVGLDATLYEPLRQLPGVKFIIDDTYNLLQVANGAIVTSGTATLETGLFRVPQVCVYKAGWLEYKIAHALVMVPYISLINLIAGKEAIRELIQEKATVDGIGQELSRLINDLSYRNSILSEYDKIYKTLDTGSASENTARLMVGYLKS